MENQRIKNQRMNEPATCANEALVDVSAARKLLDEPLAVQQVDLPVFSLRCDAVTYMRINQC